MKGVRHVGSDPRIHRWQLTTNSRKGVLGMGQEQSSGGYENSNSDDNKAVAKLTLLLLPHLSRSVSY